MQHSCGSARRQRSCVGTSPPHHLHRRSSKVEFNQAAIPPHLRRDKSRRKCSGRPGCGPSAHWRRLCQSSLQGSKTFALAALPRCQPQTAPGSTVRALMLPESFVSALSWVVPAQAPEAVCPTPLPPVFVGVWEPKVSQTLHRQSSPAPTPSRPPPGPRSTRFALSAPYGTGRLTEAPHGHRRNRSICETASTIGLHRGTRPNLITTLTDISRPKGCIKG